MVQQAETEIKARKLIEPSRLPDTLYGNRLDNATKLKLAMGERVFFEKIEVPSDSGGPAFVRAGTIRLSDENGIKFHTDFAKDNLDIPETLFGKPLTKQEMEALEARKTLGPLRDDKGQEVYVSVDRQTNRVVIESPYTLKVPDELMGHKLTDEDKRAWVNGEQLQPRVYEHKGEHFIANIQKNGNGGLTITDSTFLKPHEVAEAKARYNTGDNIAPSKFETERIQTERKQTEKQVSETPSDKTQQVLPKFEEIKYNNEIKGDWYDMNIQSLERLVQQGKVPDREELNAAKEFTKYQIKELGLTIYMSDSYDKSDLYKEKDAAERFSKELDKIQPIEKTNDNTQRDPLMEAIKAKDFTTIARLAQKVTPKTEHTEFIDRNYSPAEKAGADALLKREQPAKGEKAVAPRQDKERTANNQKQI